MTDASTPDPVERLRRLEALDELLPTLAGVLDVREVFERVSSIARRVIPHDLISLPLLTQDGADIVIYAVSGTDSPMLPRTVPMPEQHRWLLTSAWEHVITPDLQDSPADRDTPPAHAGLRARLLVPIRASGALLGAIDFMSYQPNVYCVADVLVARRIADHVALALSHQRIAEEVRRASHLQERTQKLELLDALLETVTTGGDLCELFDRVSAVAQKVLPHDAMVIPVLQPDGAHVKFHVTKSPEGAKFPSVIEVPPHLRGSDWDSDVVKDLQADPVQRTFAPARLGYRAALRVPIRVENRLVAGVGFFSFTPGVFTEQDVLVARRIADRLALNLLREQGEIAERRADEANERAARLESRVQSLTNELNARAGFRCVVGKSASWHRVLTQATQVAATDTTVLLLGESGTGKEVAARFIHRASARSGGPFVAINCAALPEPLLESELFGYERGAFTGAQQAKPGQLEQAAGGVLFLDEVAEMSPGAQAKFLRVLQEREFQRLGGTRMLKANVRVIAATNRKLRAAMESGAFREDLYYRLHVFEISLPPLRDRRDDILPLSEMFLEDIAKAFGRPPAGLSREGRDSLLTYSWPGNVRELRNMLERAAILCDGGLITAEHLTFLHVDDRQSHVPPSLGPVVMVERGRAALPSTDLKGIERAAIERALTDARHNKSQAAKMLGLTRKQLYVRLRQHGLV